VSPEVYRLLPQFPGPTAELWQRRGGKRGVACDEHLWKLRGINARVAQPPLAPPYEGGEDVARRLVARDEHLCWRLRSTAAVLIVVFRSAKERPFAERKATLGSAAI